jgi:hypothetical protein
MVLPETQRLRPFVPPSQAAPHTVVVSTNMRPCGGTNGCNG